ncbi:MAG: MFS transporter [Eubacteriaceae bacterium]
MRNRAENKLVLSDWNTISKLLPLLLFAIFDSMFTSFAPILARIAESFPNVSTTMIQMILTMPSLTLVPTTLFAGVIATYIHKKTIAQFALVIMGIGGIIPLIIHSSINALFISSAIIGVGQGLLMPLSSSIICEYFSGRERGTVMGFRQAADYIGAAALTILAGYLGLFAWYNVYWIYILVIPVLIITSIFLPKGNLEVKLVGKGIGLKGIKNILTPSFIYMCFICFFVSGLFFAFYTNISMMIVEKGIGDSADAAKVSSLNFILSLIVALSFGFILRLFKKYTLAMGFLILSLAFFILSFATSLSVTIIGGMVFGLGTGYQQICSIFYISESVPKTSATIAISAALAVIGLGVSFSPIIINTVKQAVIGVDTATASLLVAGVGYLIVFIVELIRETVFNKNSNIGI